MVLVGDAGGDRQLEPGGQPPMANLVAARLFGE